MTQLNLCGDTFGVNYQLMGTEEQALKMASDICLEQTVEVPEELLQQRDIREQILGQVVALDPLGQDCYCAVIAFPVEVAGAELSQLLNVIYGNISLKPGIRVLSLDLPERLLKHYRGPRFGIDGLRQLLGVDQRPLLCTALKPMGLSPQELADLAYRFALGGIDLIKDDHGLADQVFCPFEQRIELCQQAVERANGQTGYRCLYLPNITGPAQQMHQRAVLAKQHGIQGALVAPGLVGFEAMRQLADDPTLALLLLAHPALLGCYTVDNTAGMSHGALYGQVNRLAGADAVIFPSFGGRFAFSQQQCRDLIHGSKREMQGIKAAFPVPAGGMEVHRVEELRGFYGDDAIFLVGGDLQRGDVTQRAAEFVQRVSTVRP